MHMRIKEIYIQSFGGLTDRHFQLDKGLNVLEGPNESGKSTLAAFIKYIFYGPGSKNAPDRKRYLTGAKAGGWLKLITDDGKPYRIERVTALETDGPRGESIRDVVRVVDLTTNEALRENKPGEYFFGVGENVFVNTAFVGQIGAVRPDGTSLAGAVENMLHTADENVDLKRASDKLNQARRELLPKNSAGGLLREKQEEKARLEEALAASRERSARAMEAEGALAEASRKRQDLETKKDRIEQVLEAAEVVSVCRKIAARDETLKRIDGYRSALDVLEAPPYSDLEERVAQLDGGDSVKPGSRLHMHNEEAAQALEEGEYLESKAKLFLTVTITMAIVGLVALAAGAIMVYFGFPSEQFLIPFVAMGVFVVLGIVFYILQGRNLSLLDDILDEWNADTLDDIYDMVQSSSAPAGKKSARLQEDTAEEIRDLAAACGIAGADDAEPEALLEALRRKAEKASADRRLAREKTANLEGRLEALEEQLEGVDRDEVAAQYKKLSSTSIGKAAVQLNAEGLARLQKEREFTEAALRAQAKREAELEQANAAGGMPESRTPDMLAGQIARLNEEIEELEKRHDGYTLAYEALVQAGQSVRTGVIPAVTEKASAIMARATGGKYADIAMDPSFGLRFTSDSGSDSVDMLSKGTADLAYIALRLALAQTLFGENGREIPPMIFDETFAAIDCGRLALAMDAMGSASVQSLLFTCRADEGRIAADRGYRVISM